MSDIIEFIGTGKPIPDIYTLISYYIPYSYGEEGYIHFKGQYRIIEVTGPTGTELDAYEKDFILPQRLIMLDKTTNDKINMYSIEIYRRIVHSKEYNVDSTEGVDQTIYYRILGAAKGA